MFCLHLDYVWLGPDQRADVDVLLDGGVVDDAGVWLGHRLRGKGVVAGEDGGEVEGVDAAVGVRGHVHRVAEGVFRGGSAGIAHEDNLKYLRVKYF